MFGFGLQKEGKHLDERYTQTNFEVAIILGS
jgi:hypothetical protein